MNQSKVYVPKEYGGIDLFRMIAAFLIVAIHTSPLSSINETADFILTRIVARVAVPFFFMTTGMFLFKNGRINKDKIRRFLIKTSLIYAVAIFLYIPVNIYMGYFKKENLIINLIKDILFDGTIYHLWYLPAVILGVLLISVLLHYIPLYVVFWISLILYIIGLFGDSYYGISSNTAIVNVMYEGIFLFSDYTRNGLFFAPIFLVLGVIASRTIKRVNIKENIIYTIIFAVLMLLEGLLLKKFNLMRHDSMYVMLLPCMYFLFSIIASINVPSNKKYRTTSMVIYIIHPMVIVFIRAVAKLLGLQEILINNSIVHFLTVALCSYVIAVFITYIFGKLNEHIGNKCKNTSRSWAEINLDNLKHNVKVLRNVMPDGCRLMAVVKANAYGHGAVNVSRYLNKIGIESFAVATIDEGIELRRKGIRGEILVLGYTDVSRARELSRYRLIQTVIDYDYAQMLNNQKHTLQVHVKVDTGMHRLGISNEDIDKIAEVFHMDKLHVGGIYTHLNAADDLSDEAVRYTEGQIEKFYWVLDELKKRNITIPKIHIQSSYGLLNYPHLRCDYARIGIALYGCLSTIDDRTRLRVDLRPVLTLRSKVAMIKEVAAGDGVGYGMDFYVSRNSRVAVLPLGYADGLPRNLSGGFNKVLIHGFKVPIIGRICMDQLLIDVTDVPDVKPGDIATIIGSEGDKEISAASIAKNAGTITNELLSRLGDRIVREYIT